MALTKFPPEVARALKLYVYRLIDPRNGETFYVGKGKGDRVFQHARGTSISTTGEDALDLKLSRIRKIVSAGLEVAHVIHRHGIETREVAFEVEAALMDAYPGLTNKVRGHGASDFGVAHVEELITAYSAEEFVPAEPLILISISQTFEERDVYDAVRGTWKVDPARAQLYNLVLAHQQGLVRGAFRPMGEWLPATPDNFPWLAEALPGRFGFEGHPLTAEEQPHYVNKRVPARYRRKGAANPVRYVDITLGAP